MQSQPISTTRRLLKWLIRLPVRLLYIVVIVEEIGHGENPFSAQAKNARFRREAATPRPANESRVEKLERLSR